MVAFPSAVPSLSTPVSWADFSVPAAVLRGPQDLHYAFSIIQFTDENTGVPSTLLKEACPQDPSPDPRDSNLCSLHEAVQPPAHVPRL